jgi:hypothetical protein
VKCESCGGSGAAICNGKTCGVCNGSGLSSIKPTYTLIAYQPSSSTHEGCHCHGTTRHFDSNFELTRGLSIEQLALKISTIKATGRTQFMSDDDNEAEWEFTYFDDLGGPNWADENEGFTQVLDDLVAQQVPSIEARERAAALAAKEKADREEQARRVKAEAEAKERREREEFERLKKKFTPKETA